MKITTNSYRQNSSFKPEAWVATQKNRQKVYKGSKIYLEDGQEFELELHNPTKSVYLAKVLINGSHISQRGIILNPGQRIFLERFIDDNRKLVYQTYEVENTEEAKGAIAENGKISIQFFEEARIIPSFGGSTITCTTFPSINTRNWNYTSGSEWYVVNASSNTTLNTTSVNTLFNDSSGTTTTATYNAGSLETGRVQQGEESDQSFENGFGTFNAWASHTSSYQILPISQLPVEVSDMRNYCSGCGTRIRKSTWKFCPNCGEILE
jgi:hypothetical protein